MVKKATFLITFSFFFCNPIYCGEISSHKSPHAAFWWSLFVPGGGYFYLGETAKGAGYFAGTAGLASWGIAVNNKKAGGEVNAPLLYTQQLHAIQIYDSYRTAIMRTTKNDTKKKILLEQSSISQLTLSPFKSKNLKSPWVIGFALLGAGLNYSIARIDHVQKDISDLHHIQILGNQFNRGTGFAVHTAYWLPASMGAALSEETVFRGMIQTEWEELWGKDRGLLATSALFGIAHYTGQGESLGNILFATAAGVFLGWRFQKNNYRLSESIAEHFWFDAIAGATLYLADPENNPLGAKVEFAF